MSHPEHQYHDKEGNIVCNWMQDDYECKAPESREGGMCLYVTDETNKCPINKLEAVKTHLESYPDERNDETYCITRHYPSTAGSHIFNSVLFLTHLETWHKKLKEILEAET